MNTKPVQPHGGPVPERVPIAPTSRANLQEALRSQSRVVTRLPLFLVVVPLLVFAGVFAFAIFVLPCSPVGRMELNQAHDISTFIRAAADDSRSTAELASPELRDAKGREFWQKLNKSFRYYYKILPRLTSLGGTDEYVDEELIGIHKMDLPEKSCSFTGPRAGDFADLLQGERCVLVTFNARNWNNYPDKGVIVIWSDKEEAEWLEFDDAEDDWGITAEEWADPAGKLFGKKAPFQHTYE